MDEVRALGKELSNWGRWGPEDQLGTLNFITPAKRVEAAGLIRRGETFSLALPLDHTGPQQGKGPGGRFNPIHTMRLDGGDDLAGAFPGEGFRMADDFVFMPLQCSTQWDALSHVWYDGQLYNGYPAATVTSAGAGRNAIANAVDRLVTRAVLLDIARLKGVDSLPMGHNITAAELDEAAERAVLTVRSGDVVLVRTGILGAFRASGNYDLLGRGTPGLGHTCIRWLHDHEVAAVCADNQAVEAISAAGEPYRMALHMVGIRDMGLSLGEYFALDALADGCASDGVYEFFFSAPPLNFPRGVGSPVTPIVVK